MLPWCPEEDVVALILQVRNGAQAGFLQKAHSEKAIDANPGARMTWAFTLNLLLERDPFKLLASIKSVKWETGDFLRPHPESTASVSTGDGRQVDPEPGQQEWMEAER